MREHMYIRMHRNGSRKVWINYAVGLESPGLIAIVSPIIKLHDIVVCQATSLAAADHLQTCPLSSFLISTCVYLCAYLLRVCLMEVL